MHCGNDRVGGAYGRIPKTWKRTAHYFSFCRWTAPNHKADIVFRLAAPHPALQRAHVIDQDLDYVEYIYQRARQWHTAAKEWGYAAGLGSDRARHLVFQVYSFRMEYQAKPGHFDDYHDAFMRMLNGSGLAG